MADSDLSEKHEGIVSSEMLGEELHTVTLQSWNRIFLRRVQSRHHSLWTNMDLIRIQKPAQQKQESKFFHCYQPKLETLFKCEAILYFLIKC